MLFIFVSNRINLLIVQHSQSGQQHISCPLLQSNKYLQQKEICHIRKPPATHTHAYHTGRVVEKEEGLRIKIQMTRKDKSKTNFLRVTNFFHPCERQLSYSRRLKKQLQVTCLRQYQRHGKSGVKTIQLTVDSSTTITGSSPLVPGCFGVTGNKLQSVWSLTMPVTTLFLA